MNVAPVSVDNFIKQTKSGTKSTMSSGRNVPLEVMSLCNIYC